MAQTALSEIVKLPADVWVLISEGNCTFQNHGPPGLPIEIRGDAALPDPGQRGLLYRPAQGEAIETDTLARFPGATHIYAISRSTEGAVFVARPAVA